MSEGNQNVVLAANKVVENSLNWGVKKFRKNQLIWPELIVVNLPVQWRSPMGRRVPRFACKASAEVTSDGATELASVTELSRYGCFVQTPNPLAPGSNLAVKVMNEGQIFAATATVVYSQPDVGMGIAFREVKSWFQALLEDWLRDLMEKRGAAVN